MTADLRPALAARSCDYSAPWRPAIDVVETDGALFVRAELAGLTRTGMGVLVSFATVRSRR